jgi:hypothetical protein
MKKQVWKNGQDFWKKNFAVLTLDGKREIVAFVGIHPVYP